jgi:hypothetical protein
MSRSIVPITLLAALAIGCGGIVVVDDRAASSENASSTGAGGASAGTGSPSSGTDSGSGGTTGVNDCTAPNVTLLASGQKHPFTIALDATNVYWGNAGPDQASDGIAHIFTVPKSGGTPKEIGTATGALYSILVDETNVYWMVYEYAGSPPKGRLYSMPKAGGPATNIFTSKSPNLLSLTMDEGRFYWVDNNGLLVSVSKSGGGTTLLEENAEAGSGHNIVVNQDRVYWKRLGGQLMATSKLVGGDAQAVTGLDVAQGDFTVDDTRAFWVASPSGPGESVATIFTTPKGGGEAVSVFHEANGAVELQQLGPCLYWRALLSTFDVAWTLSVAPKSGGEPIVLFQQASSGSDELQAAYAVDASGVYWVDRSAGNVMKATK